MPLYLINIVGHSNRAQPLCLASSALIEKIMTYSLSIHLRIHLILISRRRKRQGTRSEMQKSRQRKTGRKIKNQRQKNPAPTTVKSSNNVGKIQHQQRNNPAPTTAGIEASNPSSRRNQVQEPQKVEKQIGRSAEHLDVHCTRAKSN